MNAIQKITGLILMLLMIHADSFSQIDPEDQKVAQAVKTEFEVLSKKIEDVMNKNPKARDMMQNHLKNISGITDTAKFRLAVQDYRATYQTAYGDMVKAAGVDMNEFVKLMTARFPAYSFNIQNSFGVAFKKKASKGTAKSGTPAASTTTTTSAITGFLQSKEASCALGAGSEITFPSKSVRSSTTAAVAGGCTATGELKKDIILPTQVTNLQLRLTWTHSIGAYAVGVAGFAIGYASCFTGAGIRNESALISEYISEMAIAPFAWVANFDIDDPFDQTVNLTASQGKTLQVSFVTHTSSDAVLCCATTATSKNTYSRANLIVTK